MNLFLARTMIKTKNHTSMDPIRYSIISRAPGGSLPHLDDPVLGAGDDVPVAGLAESQARYPVKMA